MKTKPAIKKRPAKKPPAKPKSNPLANGTVHVEPAEVFTLREAAAFLRVKETDIRNLIDAGGFPGRKVGDDWRVLKTAVCDWLNMPEASDSATDWRESNQRLLDLAGSWKDDETISELLEFIHQERDKHPLEEIQS